ncbi:hypothetical protein OSSY52_03710 [Tepiditoga spiralis]|uniref:Glycosyltransferase 2-like domain-containing protein n=1 Tax=Tepiditoga spiralis TaxID=2108365 RepID=A0A7G1G1U7_9BACT|nr:glycosyltransferase family 2 protein [Tepiditoga spiralis]BBE30230.1 hypothetical protein OSSY52_03710 [Tepiditoga spiralis]
MCVEILMSTLNKRSIKDLFLKEKNINRNIVIINQTNRKGNYIDGKNNIRMLNYNEMGTSISKNRAINNANCNLCILADDDIFYVKNYDEIIENQFSKNLDADVLTFQIKTPENKLYKNYIKKEMWHTKRTITKVSMIEIAFRRNRILEKNIKFDLDFGINCRYKNGEENIFLMDCIKEGLKIKYIPIPIVIHPDESSGKIIDEKGLFARGALFFRLFRYKALLVNLVFILKKYKMINQKLSILNAIKAIYKGTFDYIKLIKMRKKI